MKTIYVRIRPKLAQSTFFRCGFKFSKAWLKVEADAATVKRLDEEQMLEVSETKPKDYEDVPAGDSAATSTDGNGSGTSADAPITPEVRLALIRKAVGELDKEDSALWTGAGKPKTEAIAALTGFPVTAAERDAALAKADEAE